MTASSPDALEFQEIHHDVSSIFLPLNGRKDMAGGLGAPDTLKGRRVVVHREVLQFFIGQ